MLRVGEYLQSKKSILCDGYLLVEYSTVRHLLKGNTVISSYIVDGLFDLYTLVVIHSTYSTTSTYILYLICYLYLKACTLTCTSALYYKSWLTSIY
jgi:hypothetical protein